MDNQYATALFEALTHEIKSGAATIAAAIDRQTVELKSLRMEIRGLLDEVPELADFMSA